MSPNSSRFRPSNADDPIPAAAPPPQPQVHDDANLTTSLYHTHLGIFSLTWSKSLFCRSLHLLLPGGPSFDCSPSSSTISFHLHMNNVLFWKKKGSKKLSCHGDDPCATVVRLFWDLTRAKFGSGPEPVSGFYVSVVVDGAMGLLVGDLEKLAFSRTRARGSEKTAYRALFLRREHVFGNRVYTTTARIGEKNREISVDCNVNGEGKLSFCVDKKRVLQVKRLKWKFRGNEWVEFDRASFQVSWDVYNWLFKDVSEGHAVFMFRFDKQDEVREDGRSRNVGDKDSLSTNSHNALSTTSSCSFGMNEIELRKMRKNMARTARSSSSSSSSLSSSASSCGSNSSVMEWASTEENELTRPVGFSLLVYAWKK
ncbi:hypothetical protein MLD38_013978 [Melastoma candidum]|uniref:Uncharacterized protein n=1 Tax=Melastoma candidum TaxID=119954 RepID=A0ACB9RFG5_9MYRT|nr:hypothetical protein MLD38_013978 [Melastoma candidum]